MRIGVVGAGYVGLVAGTCLADGGNHVMLVDKDERKIRMLEEGEVPIYEPGLAEIIQRNAKAGRLTFTTDLAQAVRESLVMFIGVGTPPAADGSADLSAIFAVAEAIADAMDGYRIVVMKSTVPVGTHRAIREHMAARTPHPFDYVSNPEFLKEGAAIDDFMRPDRVIIGADNPAVVEIMKEIYAPFMRTRERILVMDPASAEMSKYAANALLATKISFMNEMSGLCDRLGADVEMVRRGIGSDARIGPAFLFPGVGYGGSCFPKDVQALMSMGQDAEYPMSITEAVHAVNQRQRRRFAEGVLRYYGDGCRGRVLAVWGLAFKARTDDVREAPAIDCIRMFLDQGIRVRAHDPEALETTRAVLGDTIELFEDGYAALDGADALVIFTDWQEFRTPDFTMIKERLNQPVIFDGRNLYEHATLARMGIEYHCIGRRAASK
ncbi:MAG TPA: UDP-glucose/GDP-mannose dehydrogenase family protein [Phycisphaerae bacterium]|nr:UDP-glucose/GDP-mannose dehydrogenase family protein [Phycisphaerae bacterium]